MLPQYRVIHPFLVLPTGGAFNFSLLLINQSSTCFRFRSSFGGHIVHKRIASSIEATTSGATSS